jgi:hypothetical protein
MSESLSEAAIRALREKRGELDGRLIYYQQEIKRIRDELSHLDAVLRMFAPDSPPENILPKHPRPPRSSLLQYGEIRRRCLEAMRENGVIAADSVVLQLMRDKSLDEGDQRLHSDLLKKTLRSLDALLREHRVEKIGKGRGVQWKIKNSRRWRIGHNLEFTGDNRAVASWGLRTAKATIYRGSFSA